MTPLTFIVCRRNPALEQQACDRIYRVGQRRDVTIHRFVCSDTVEERIVQLQNKKLSLAKNILTGLVRQLTQCSVEFLMKPNA